MAYAICADTPGGVEVLDWRDIPTPKPGMGEAVVHQTKVGLNYIDIYMTSGTYPFPESGPQIPGGEAAGIVAALGEGVTELSVGDRVAYTTPNGAYREERVMPADRLVKLPDGVSDEVAAASMLKGMTVEYLLNRSFKVKPGQKVLFHAAAGGVGLIAGQWLRHIGAESIGTVGSDEKIAQAKAAGYTHVINYNSSDFTEEVHALTDGKGVAVAYDSIGQDTYPHTLSCLEKFGLFNYIDTRENLNEVSSNMFRMIAEGHIKMDINQRYALKDVPKAFAALMARKTTGATVFDTGRG